MVTNTITTWNEWMYFVRHRNIRDLFHATLYVMHVDSFFSARLILIIMPLLHTRDAN